MELIKYLKNKYSEYSFVIIFTIIFSLIFFFNGINNISPYQDIDNFVFRNIAYFIKRGLVLYKDFGDNKGPYLYFVNYLFLIFDKIHIIYYFTLLLSIITNIYIYKIAKISLNKTYSNIVMVLTNCLFICYMTDFPGGVTNNMVEFYSMPIFSYIYYKYLKRNEIKNKNIIIIGLLTGILFNLRANLISISFICSFIIVIEYFINKNYIKIINYALYFLLGFLISFIPIIIYFIKAGSLSYYIDGYLLFNIKYSGTMANQISYTNNQFINHLILAFTHIAKFSSNTIILSIISVYMISIIKYKKEIDNFIIFLFCFIFATFISARPYQHYVWIMVPLVSLPISLLFSGNAIKDINKIIAYALFISSFFIYLSGVREAIIYKLKPQTQSIEYYNMIEEVKKNTTYDDDIFACIELRNDAYIDIGLMPSGKYILDYYFDYVYDNFINELDSDNPSIIIIDKTKYSNDKWFLYLYKVLEDNYNNIYKNEMYEVYKKR